MLWLEYKNNRVWQHCVGVQPHLFYNRIYCIFIKISIALVGFMIQIHDGCFFKLTWTLKLSSFTITINEKGKFK